MRYFKLECDEERNVVPNIVNWYDKINPQYIHIGKSSKIPKREILNIVSQKYTTVPDVIHRPFFLVSEKFKMVIELYDESIVFKEIVLLDGINDYAELYYLPILQELDCLSDDSIWNQEHTMLKKIVLKKDKIRNLSLFKISGVGQQCVIARLDMVESLIRRGITAVKATPVEVK